VCIYIYILGKSSLGSLDFSDNTMSNMEQASKAIPLGNLSMHVCGSLSLLHRRMDLVERRHILKLF
jgi:hypothetical protein